MDTKTQSLSSIQPHPQTSRSQGHTCNQCSCSHHCRSCSQAGHPSSSSSPSPPSRHPKQTMHSRHSPKYRSCGSKNRKTLEGKVNKRKAVRRRKRTYRAKKRRTGICPVGDSAAWEQGRGPRAVQEAISF
ncbi:Nuclear transition protein 2 [Lemmus lemmus]